MLDDLTYERVGSEWLFSDGSRVPVVAGGSDAGAADVGAGGGGEAAPAPAPATAPAPAVSTPAPAAGQAAPAVDAGLPDGAGDAFDELGDTRLPPGGVKALRQEAARYRTALREYEAAFGSLHPDDRAALASFAQAYASGDYVTAAQMLGEWQQALTPAEKAAVQAATGVQAQTVGEAAQYLTADQLERILDQREQRQREAALQAQRQQQVEASKQSLVSKAVELGYNPQAEYGSDDHEAYVLLLNAAKALWDAGRAQSIEEALTRAHERLAGTNQQAVRRFVEQRVADARSTPAPVGPGAGVPVGRTPAEVIAAAKPSERTRVAAQLIRDRLGR